MSLVRPRRRHHGDRQAADPSDAPRITPTRKQLDNRFPSLGFTVSAGKLPWYEVLLATDATLFDPANAARRSPADFYASRQDGGLNRVSGPEERFLVPAAVLRSFTEATPRPSRIHYTVVAYADEQGSGARFAIDPADLPTAAPWVALAPGFTGHTLSKVLGIPIERLRRVTGTATGGRALGLDAATSPLVDAARDAGEGEDGYSFRLAAAPGPGAPSSGEVPAAAGTASQQPAAPPRPASRGAWHLPPIGRGQAPPVGIAGGNGGQARAATAFTAGLERPAVGHAPTRPPSDDYDDGWGTDWADLDAAWNHGEGDRDAEPPLPPVATTQHGASVPGWTQAAAVGAGESGPEEPVPDDEVDELDWGERPYRTDVGEDAALAFEALDQPAPASAPVAFGPDLAAPPPAVAPSSTNGGAPDGMPPTPAVEPTDSAAALLLTDDAKRQIIERVAVQGAEGSYSALNTDGEFSGRLGPDHPAYGRWHVGLSFGIGPFTQHSGLLGQLLVLMRERDHELFANVFGPDADQLVRVTTAPGPAADQAEDGRGPRVQPVAEVDLWRPPWTERFREAGRHPAFQAAQNQLAAMTFLDPMLRFADWLGLDTDRALCMVVDRAMQQGADGARHWIIAAVGPVQTPAQRQQALAALGFADVEAFQAAGPADLLADGQFGPLTHAAMVAALRHLGLASPIPLPTLDQMLDAMLRRAGGERWAQRVERLRTATDFSDRPFRLP